MKKVLSIILVLLLLALSFPVGATTTEEEIEGNYVEGEAIIIVSENGVAATSAEDKALFENSTLLYSKENDIASTGKDLSSYTEGVYSVKSDTLSTTQLVNKFSKMDGVISAEPNYIYQLDSLDNSVETKGEIIKDYTKFQFSANEENSDIPSWNDKNNVNSEDIVLAVMDTGIAYNNKDLVNVMWKDGENYEELVNLGGGEYGIDAASAAEGQPSKFPMDVSGHGTHCAGIIAGQWNEFGVSGVCNGAKLMAIKIENGAGALTDKGILFGYNYLIKARQCGVNVKAVNCSWGGGQISFAVNYLVDELGKYDVLTVFSSGNDSKDLDKYPTDAGIRAQSKASITVGASNQKNELAWFSNYGIRTTDVIAPGDKILATYLNYRAASPELVEPMIVDPVDGDHAKFSYNHDAGYEMEISEEVGYDDNYSIYIKPDDVNTREMPLIITFENLDNRINLEDPVFMQFYTKHEDASDGFLIETTGRTNATASDFYSPVKENGWGTTHIMVPPENIDIENKTIKVEYNFVFRSSKEGVRGSYIDNISLTNNFCEYDFLSGTSMSAPFVTGEVGLACAKYKDESIDKIKARIIGSVNKTEEISNNLLCREGIVNVNKMLSGDTCPVVSTISYDNDSITIDGYFFDNLREVTVGDKVATIKSSTSESIVIQKPEGLTGTEALIKIKTDTKEGRYMAKISDANLVSRIDIDKTSEAYKKLTELYQPDSIATENCIYYLGRDLKGDTSLICYDIKKNTFEVAIDKIQFPLLSNMFIFDGKVCVVVSQPEIENKCNILMYDPNKKDWRLTPNAIDVQFDLGGCWTHVLPHSGSLFMFGARKNELDKNDLVFEIEIDKSNDYETKFTLLEGTTQVHADNPYVFSDDNAKIYIFNCDRNKIEQSFVEVVTIGNLKVHSEKVYNPFTCVDKLSNYYAGLKISKTNDSFLIIGADKIENNVKVADIYEMKFGDDKFVPRKEMLSSSLIAYTSLASYQGYTYALCGSIPNEEEVFLAKFDSSYYYPEYEQYELGDADGDMDVTIIDATIIQKYMANLIDSPVIKLGAADANKDSDVSILDANKIQRILANLDKD